MSETTSRSKEKAPSGRSSASSAISSAASSLGITPSAGTLDDSFAREHVFGTLRFILVLSIAAMGIYLGSWRQFGLAVLIATGAVVAGAFLGFLFGIPRAGSSNDGNAYKPNTNLEQVSDWLTKIIIGVSLVELHEIGTGLDTMVTRLEVGFRITHPYPFVWALIVAYFFYGLIGGYLLTRVYLPVMFAKADMGTVSQQEAREIAEGVVRNASERNAEALRLAEFQLSADPGAVEVAQEELNKAIHEATQNIKSDIHFRARRFRMEHERPSSENPDAILRALPVLDALIADDVKLNNPTLFHSNHAQKAFVLLHSRNPDFENARRALDEAIKVRDRVQDKDYRHYEYMRAVANIGTWKAGNMDTEQLHKSIHDDLLASVTALPTIRDNEHKAWVKEWMAARKVTDIPIDKKS